MAPDGFMARLSTLAREAGAVVVADEVFTGMGRCGELTASERVGLDPDLVCLGGDLVNYFRDLRPYVSKCRFPDCTHSHEADCAVKDAVADGHLDARRYESYLSLLDEQPA